MKLISIKFHFTKMLLKDTLELYPCDLETRFNVINVIIGKEEPEIEHIPNTF